MPNLRPFATTAQPLTAFFRRKNENFLASGQINGQFSLIEGIMVSGGAANRYRVREGTEETAACSWREELLGSNRHPLQAPPSLRYPSLPPQPNPITKHQPSKLEIIYARHDK